MAPSQPAYSFTTDTSFGEMLATLERHAQGKWRLADSDTYGDYLVRYLEDGVTRVRVFRAGSSYVLDVQWIGGLPGVMSRQAVDEAVQREILIPLGASAVTRRESWD